MKDMTDLLKGIENDIQELLYKYVSVPSFTYSEGEREAVSFLMEYFSQIPYFQQHPEMYGTYEIDNDPFDRKVCFGMVKGSGSDTAVLIHHYDVVEIDDFKKLKPMALKPDELEAELKKMSDSLPEDVREDLESGQFMFGRGTCDMKGGGAIQLSLLERYSRKDDFKGNVIVLMVPDEENLSAGMRAGVKLLADLKEKYDLNYKIMIDSEPHQRKDHQQGVFSEGSVGKIMPFIYVRGYLSHIGKVFEGLNPINLMSEIVRRTELNMDFSDAVEGECAPPPTWLYMKDDKKHYDVSMPLSAAGCFNILTLNQDPASLMERVAEICRASFAKIIGEMNERYERFSELTEPAAEKLPWIVNVQDFAELYREAYDDYGETFREAYDKKIRDISSKFREGKGTIIESNFELVQFMFDYIDDLSPRVIYGLIPPYYPNVSNLYFRDIDPAAAGLSEQLNKFTMEQFEQTYTREYFFTGICDLSYTSIGDGAKTLEALRSSMPLLGEFYDIPVEAIEKISMPCMNIGPWGKDLHKLTERVSKEDLYVRTPRIINKAVSIMLDAPQLV